MRTCAKCSGVILNKMQSMSKQALIDMLRFVESQTAFIIKTTVRISNYQDFLNSDDGMVLFNSTCMCLQTIGETIRQVDDRTHGCLFSHYPEIPWRQIIGMRNIISHEYLSIDPELIYDITSKELPPLLASLHQILIDIDAGLRNKELGE